MYAFSLFLLFSIRVFSLLSLFPQTGVQDKVFILPKRGLHDRDGIKVAGGDEI